MWCWVIQVLHSDNLAQRDQHNSSSLIFQSCLLSVWDERRRGEEKGGEEKPEEKLDPERRRKKPP